MSRQNSKEPVKDSWFSSFTDTVSSIAEGVGEIIDEVQESETYKQAAQVTGDFAKSATDKLSEANEELTKYAKETQEKAKALLEEQRKAAVKEQKPAAQQLSTTAEYFSKKIANDLKESQQIIQEVTPNIEKFKEQKNQKRLQKAIKELNTQAEKIKKSIVQHQKNLKTQKDILDTAIKDTEASDPEKMRQTINSARTAISKFQQDCQPFITALTALKCNRFFMTYKTQFVPQITEQMITFFNQKTTPNQKKNDLKIEMIKKIVATSAKKSWNIHDFIKAFDKSYHRPRRNPSQPSSPNAQKRVKRHQRSKQKPPRSNSPEVQEKVKRYQAVLTYCYYYRMMAANLGLLISFYKKHAEREKIHLHLKEFVEYTNQINFYLDKMEELSEAANTLALEGPTLPGRRPFDIELKHPETGIFSLTFTEVARDFLTPEGKQFQSKPAEFKVEQEKLFNAETTTQTSTENKTTTPKIEEKSGAEMQKRKQPEKDQHVVTQRKKEQEQKEKEATGKQLKEKIEKAETELHDTTAAVKELAKELGKNKNELSSLRESRSLHASNSIEDAIESGQQSEPTLEEQLSSITQELSMQKNVLNELKEQKKLIQELKQKQWEQVKDKTQQSENLQTEITKLATDLQLNLNDFQTDKITHNDQSDPELTLTAFEEKLTQQNETLNDLKEKKEAQVQAQLAQEQEQKQKQKDHKTENQPLKNTEQKQTTKAAQPKEKKPDLLAAFSSMNFIPASFKPSPFQFTTNIPHASPTSSGSYTPYRPDHTAWIKKAALRINKKYDTEANQKTYKDKNLNGKESPTYFWKKLAPRSSSRDDMVNLANLVTTNAKDENKAELLYATLLLIKEAIEKEDPWYTSVLWCLVDELIEEHKDKNRIIPTTPATKKTLSDFWKTQNKTPKNWDVDQAITDSLTLKA